MRLSQYAVDSSIKMLDREAARLEKYGDTNGSTQAVADYIKLLKEQSEYQKLNHLTKGEKIT